MAILTSINGIPGTSGFLLAPLNGRMFPVSLGLRTDDGSTVSVTLERGPGGENLQVERETIEVGPVEGVIQIQALSASGARNDMSLRLVANNAVQTELFFTAISRPDLLFQGRFQARFATDRDQYNDPIGTPTGWTWAFRRRTGFCPCAS